MYLEFETNLDIFSLAKAGLKMSSWELRIRNYGKLYDYGFELA